MMNKKTESYANSTYKVKNRYDTSARIVPFLFLKNVLQYIKYSFNLL